MSHEVCYSACALNCPDICAYRVHVENGRVTRVEGDPNHPYTLGRCCPKGYSHVIRTYYEDRLRYPLRKQGDGIFRRIGWDAALDEIASRMKQAKAESGPQSLGVYCGSGNDGMAPRYAARFASVFGCRMIPGIAEICFEAAYEGARFNVGPFPPHEMSDWANSRCIIIWGTNKFESSLHTKRVIQEAIDNGAKLIVIDPQRTPHAKAADIYSTIRPGTDAALALGVANEIIARNLYNHDFVQNCILGFPEYAKRAAEYDKDRVSRLTWVDPDTIEEIAVVFATHGPGLIMTAPAGMNHYTNGTWAARAVHSLLAICGYLGVPGGGFQYLSSDFTPFNGQAVALTGLLDSSVKPIVPSATYIPDLVLSQTESPIRVLVIQAANPVTQWPDATRTISALKKIPFKVCIDLELTDTARLCDIVLPATFIFEHHNLVHSELHRIVQYAPKLIEPVGEARSELDIWKALAERLGMASYFRVTELDMIGLALQSHDCSNMTIEDLIEHPEGIRTQSPAVPFADRKFRTPSGKVELYSEQLARMGFDPLPFHEEPAESPVSTPKIAEEYPLIMISGRLKTRLHSQYTTVSLGGSAKSYAYCTTCQECVKRCPEEAISLVQPTVSVMREGVRESGETKAKMREKLGQLVDMLATQPSDAVIRVPEFNTSLLVPSWDKTRCIGCRECEVDVCPYKVVKDSLQMPCRGDVEPSRCYLRMHPNTARLHGLRAGDRITVESPRGHVSGIRLEITEDIDPRVVWSSDGWWNEDGNMNLLTSCKHTAFGHTPGFNSVLVRVRKCPG